MSGSFTFAPYAVPRARRPDLVVAAIYDVAQDPPWAVLPNVRPVEVAWNDGLQPPTARLRYAFDEILYPEYPSRLEHVLSLAATGDGVVYADDRIAVFRLTFDGERTAVDVLFEGYAQVPQGDYSTQAERATFTAVGTPIREWDTPLGGALIRSAATPKKPNADIQTDRPARFNPGGEPNATPESDPEQDPPEEDPPSADSTPPGGLFPAVSFPVFLGPHPGDRVGGADLRMWTLEMAVRYVLARGNPRQKHTKYDYDAGALKGILYAAVPKKDGGLIRIDESDSYTKEPIEVHDLDVAGMAWPDALEAIIRPHGFAARWVLVADEDLKMTWHLLIDRLDDLARLKDLRLQKAGGVLDPALTNVQELRLARDSHAVANVVEVAGAAVRVEASFVLAPEKPVAAADVDTLDNFVLGNAGCTGDNQLKYRSWVLDEAGEGHWNPVTSTYTEAGTQAPAALKGVLGTKEVFGGKPPLDGGVAVRRREPLSPVISAEPSTGEPFQAELWVSFDYGRTAPGKWKQDVLVPGVWDGTGTWDRVTSGWRMMDDRVGVAFIGANVNDVHGGERDDYEAYGGAFAPVFGGGNPFGAANGTLPLVELCQAFDAAKRSDFPVFRLTCVVEADAECGARADGTAASPTSYEVVRRYDARDRFRRHVVSRYSHLSAFLVDKVPVDDTADAEAMAAQNLRAHQFPSFAGSVAIPRITGAYLVGDKIRRIDGRAIDFDVTTGEGSSPVYPRVVGLTWSFDGEQRTTLQLADRRAEWAPRRQRQSAPRFRKDATA